MGGRLLIGSRDSFVAAAVLVAGGALAWIALFATGTVRGAWGFVAATALAAGAAAALLGWMRATRAAEQIAAVDDELADEQQELAHEVEAQEDELARRERELERERAQRRLEHEWNRELRAKVLELQEHVGLLGDGRGDIRELVLRTAMALLEADKGLLLSRDDGDADGDLDMACAVGFERDPAHSPVAQRFARAVLDRDETLREDDVEGDAEIQNLIAIPMYLRDRFSGVVVVCNVSGSVHEHDDEVLLALGDHAGAVLHNARLHGALRSSYLATVAMLADAIQAKDPLLRGHSDQVARIVTAVADRLGLEGEKREVLVFGSLLHDIGKLGVSERILLKPAQLTPEERSVVELHPRIGYRLVDQVPALRPIAPAVLYHHERFDGDGYPSKLKGEQIPLEARIIAVADSFSAMTTERPYRPTMTIEEACEELERCAGTQFDPDVVRCFVAEVRRNPSALDGDTNEDLAARDAELEVRRESEDGTALFGFGAYTVVDNLTLLYSRRHLHECAHAEAQRGEVQGRPFAVLLVELAELDRVNREQGYAAGDEILRRAANALAQTGGRCGGTACRFGGRRLALVVPGAGEEVADRLAEELLGDLCGLSVRVAHAVWRDGEGGDDLIDRAREALSSAARVG